MMKFYLFFMGCFLSATVAAQKIQVLETTAQLPVSGVAVYNQERSKSGVTDFDGNVDISAFTASEEIIFQHISHQQKILSKEEIIKNNNTVYLTADASALDEVVVSVAKFKQNRKDIPQQIVSITSNDISFRNPQTAADLLESSGQVYVQKSQLGGGSPLIRGFSTNRLLLAVDGIRFNTAIFRGGNVQNVISIDPFIIDRTEVILGPGSVIYGSDAVGGVMNFYTKKPTFSLQEGISISGNATTRYATANNEKTGHVDINVGKKKWAFLSSVSYSDFGDLRMGYHGPDDYLRLEYVTTQNGTDVTVNNPDPLVQTPTGYQQLNTMQRIRFMPSEKWDVHLGLFYTTTSNYDRYDRLVVKRGEALRSAEWYYGPQQWLSGNLQITHKSTSWYDESKMSLSYQRFKESRHDRDFGDPVLFSSEEKVDAYTAGWDFIKKINKVDLFYGLEGVYNKVHSSGSKKDITTQITMPQASRYPDGATWQSYAAYASVAFKMAETLSFQGGLRYNYIFLNAEFESDFYDFPFSEAKTDHASVTGSAGLTWNPNKVFGGRINFGTAFRAPNIDDIGKIFDSEPGSVVVPNPNLKPEYAYNGELGVTLSIENAVLLDLATYVTHLEDALVRRDYALNGVTQINYQGELSRVQAIQNAAEARVYGFEATVKINFSKELQLTSAYTLTDGYEEDEEGAQNPIRHAAPQFGNTHLIFTKNKWKLDAFAIYNGQFDFKDLAPSQQNNVYLYAKDANGDPYSPKWYTLNIATEYHINEALRVNAALENITDQRYRQYSSGISAPGSNFILALSYKF